MKKAAKAALQADIREQRSQRFCRLMDMFAEMFEDDPQSAAVINAILEAKMAPEHSHAQARAICLCLSEAMDNPFMPTDLHNAISEALVETQNAVKDTQSMILRSGGLVPVLIANFTNQTKEQPTK